MLRPESLFSLGQQRAAAVTPSVLLPMLAYIAYVGPAAVAGASGRHWHAFLFAALAVLGALQLGGQLFFSAAATEHLAAVADWWGYFCFLQVAFAVLGPEDPWLARVRSTAGGPTAAPSLLGVPLDVLLLSRLVPLGAFLVMLAFGQTALPLLDSSRLTTWQRRCLLTNTLLYFSGTSWWLASSVRRTQALEVLSRGRYWSRVWVCFVLPCSCIALVALFAMRLGGGLLFAVLHLACAAGAATAMAAVFSRGVDVTDRSQENRLVVPWLLAGVVATLIPTLCIALWLDMVGCPDGSLKCTSHWRWPTLSMASASPAGHFALALGVPPLLVAGSATAWIIDIAPLARRARLPLDRPSASMLWEQRLPRPLPSAPPKLRVLSRWLGCRLMVGSMALGAAAALCPENTPIRAALHVTATILFFVMLLFAVLLCAAGADNSTLFGLFRVLVTALIIKCMVALLVLFVLVNQYVPNELNIPHAIYAGTEYLLLVLLGLWPLTWAEDVRDIRPASIYFEECVESETSQS